MCGYYLAVIGLPCILSSGPQNEEIQQLTTKAGFPEAGVYYWTYGYGSIPINTIFNGMNIHLPAILMWTTGVQGFDTLPYDTYLLTILDVNFDAQHWVDVFDVFLEKGRFSAVTSAELLDISIKDGNFDWNWTMY